MYHVWWSCKKIKRFWDTIDEEIKKILKSPIEKKPEAYLLGLLGKDIPQEKKVIFLYATTATRTVLASKWKSELIPSKEE